MNEERTEGWIPSEGQWTFKDQKVADNFDAHVREQLPWYELATKAVAHIGRHYIPTGGTVYDVGASTGNIGRALAPCLADRKAKFIAIEESQEMANLYRGPDTLVVKDAVSFPYEHFDFMVCFLSLMFFPICARRDWITMVESKIRPGGAIVIVDKVTTPPGYVGTVLRRLAMSWKLDSGTSHADIIAKELSLAGYQRPMSPDILAKRGTVFFSLGEFTGWLIERPE